MNAVEFAVRQLIPLLDKAGVLNLYIAKTPEHRKLCSPEQVLISDLLEHLVDFTKEKHTMTFEETLEHFVRSVVVDTLENLEQFEALNARLTRVEEQVQTLLPETTSARISSLERRLELFGNYTTRSQVKDIAFETVRDADMDVLFGSYVEEKIDEQLGTDEFRDWVHDIIGEKLERVEISLKVK